MAYQIMLSGLLQKHVELQSTLRELEAKADTIESDIGKIADAIKVVAPDYPVEDLKPIRRKQRRIVHKRGDMQKLLGAFIKSTVGEFTSTQAKEFLLQTGQFNLKRSDASYFTLRCMTVLKKFADLGVIKEIRTREKTKSIVWLKIKS